MLLSLNNNHHTSELSKACLFFYFSFSRLGTLVIIIVLVSQAVPVVSRVWLYVIVENWNLIYQCIAWFASLTNRNIIGIEQGNEFVTYSVWAHCEPSAFGSMEIRSRKLMALEENLGMRKDCCNNSTAHVVMSFIPPFLSLWYCVHPSAHWVIPITFPFPSDVVFKHSSI